MKRRVAALSAYCSAIVGLTASGLILGTLGVSGQEILYEHPNAEAVEIRSEVVQGSDVAVDLYYPADRGDGPIPAVILVIGYPDDALPVGSLKDTGYYRSWGRLLAAEGMVGVIYSTDRPAGDLYVIMEFLQGEARRLQIDTERVALWSASANAALALKYARSPGRIDPSAFVAYSGLLPTPDRYQATALDSMSAQFGFVLPPYVAAENYPSSLPIYLVRAGLDRFPEVLSSIDHFVQYALEGNLRLTVRNYPGGHHSFDFEDDTEETRSIIAETLAFLRRHLHS